MPHGAKGDPRDYAADHPPEELLELLVLAPGEVSPELRESVTAHVRECTLCKSVFGLLLQFHRAVESEAASPHVETLVRAIFSEDDPVNPDVRRKKDTRRDPCESQE